MIKKKNSILLKGGTIYNPVEQKYIDADILIEHGKIKKVGSVKVGKEMTVFECENKIHNLWIL